AQISDAVIDSAIAEMPPPYVRLDGPRLRADLISRRERLPQAAREFYRVLAREVDFRATDDRDLAEITRSADGAVRIAISPLDSLGTHDTPYLERRFEPADTREVRVFLNANDDRAIVRGAAARDITVRIIGGDGDDMVIDSVPGGDRALRVYDAAGNDRVVSPAGTTIDRKPYRPPSAERVQHTVRDWGSWSFMQRAASYAPSFGVLASISHTWLRYGFRQDPFASRSTVRLDVSVNEQRPRLTYDGTFRKMNSTQFVDLRLMASGLELIRFHGFGNETRSDSATSYYRVFQNLFRVEPAWVFNPNRHTTWSLGGVAQYTSTRDDAATLVGDTQPYGSGTFGEVGARLAVVVD
ncbi:MAG: hypothetical protein ACREOG_17980, partial [Gemmatimonadaceae bacterium]